MSCRFDRYLVISRPHTARRLCTTKKARLLAMIMILFSVLYNVRKQILCIYCVAYKIIYVSSSSQTEKIRNNENNLAFYECGVLLN